MATVTSKDGTQIAYEKLGSGSPLILVDGALCSRAFGPMPKLARILAEHFTVFMYDRRGRNESGDTKPYAPEREVEDLEALIREAGGSAYVYGISSGAGLSLRAAATGLNISKLALYEPPFEAPGEQDGAPKDMLQQLQTRIDEGRRADTVKYFMKIVGVPGFGIFMMSLLPMFKKLKAVAHTLPYDIQVMDQFKMPEEKARSIKVPALLSAGTKTSEPIKRSVKWLSEHIAGSQLKMLDGQTHNVSEKAIAPVLIEFFNSK
jgi:pimeloyl-ACP methyl ester carboxylesterase